MDLKTRSITVAVLTYNRGKTATKSICSIADDPYVAFVCVFDDGSTKDNLALLHNCSYSFKNVHIVENKENIGYCNNLIKALQFLSHADTEYAFLCESDMLLAKGWGKMVSDAFYHSSQSVALSPMLHRDQFRPNRSAIFRKRLIEGEYRILPDGKKEQLKKPLGSCYTDFPDAQIPITLKRQKIHYISNTVGTIVFRTSLLKKFICDIKQISEYPEQEDAWLSWACFAYNHFNPKSLIVLDPGIALTFGEAGLHGPMICNNLRWTGSFWWRYKWASKITRIFYFIRYKLKYLYIFLFIRNFVV